VQPLEIPESCETGTLFAAQRDDRIARVPIVGIHRGVGITRSSHMRTVTPPEHREGIVAKTIEQQTAKLPSDISLWLAGGAIIGSLILKVNGREKDALFVGQWPAPFLLLGVYNKLVKLHGSD
jgi:hypothetical protein